MSDESLAPRADLREAGGRNGLAPGRKLSRERLAEQADTFATALEFDLIGVEDFARPR
ncbi:MAG: hypothetical protein ACRDL0_10730 [Thermoleophilaceae bacterium]